MTKPSSLNFISSYLKRVINQQNALQQSLNSLQIYDSVIAKSLSQLQPIIDSQKSISQALTDLRIKLQWFGPNPYASIITNSFQQFSDLFQPDPALIQLFEKLFDKRLLAINREIGKFDYLITSNAPEGLLSSLDGVCKFPATLNKNLINRTIAEFFSKNNFENLRELLISWSCLPYFDQYFFLYQQIVIAAISDLHALTIPSLLPLIDGFIQTQHNSRINRLLTKNEPIPFQNDSIAFEVILKLRSVVFASAPTKPISGAKAPLTLFTPARI